VWGCVYARVSDRKGGLENAQECKRVYARCIHVCVHVCVRVCEFSFTCVYLSVFVRVVYSVRMHVCVCMIVQVCVSCVCVCGVSCTDDRHEHNMQRIVYI